MLHKHVAPRLRRAVWLSALMLLSATDIHATATLIEAEGYWLAGQPHGAITAIKDRLQAHPDDAHSRLLLAKVYLDLADPRAAEQEIERALAGGIPRAQVLVPLAQSLLDQGEPQRMLREIRVSEAPTAQEQALLTAMRGEAYLALDEPDKAATELGSALRQDPSLARAILGQARLEQLKEAWGQVRALIDKALGADPASARAWALLAQVESSELRHKEAEAAYTKAIGLARSKWQQHYYRALVRVTLGDFEGAEADIAAVEGVHPRYAGLDYAKGMLLFARRDAEQAYLRFERYLRSDPTHANSLYFAGVAAFTLGNLEQAANYLTRYMDAAPGSVLGAKALGMTLVARRDFAAADALLTPFARLKNADPILLDVLSRAYEGLGRLEEMEKLLERLLTVQPENTTLLLKLAKVRRARGDYKAAEQTIERLLLVSPDDLPAQLFLVQLNVDRKNTAGALSAAEDLLRTAPEDPYAHIAGGAAYMAAGDLDAARSAMIKALELSPDSTDAALSLAKLEARAGDVEAAKGYLEQVLRIDPGHAQSLLALAGVELQQGEGEKAILRLRAALERDPRNADVRVGLVQAYLAAGDSHQALTVVGDTPTDQAETPAMLEARGAVELATGQGYSAVRTFELLVELRPNSAAVHYRLALALAVAKSETGARSELMEAVRIDGSHPLLGQTLAQVLAMLPDSRSRSEFLSELSGLAPVSTQIKAARAMAALNERNYGKAVSIFKSLQRSQPDDPGFVRGLVQAQRAKGDSAAAIATLDAWVEKHPDDSDSRGLLAQLYSQNGEEAKARDAYARVLEERPDDLAVLNNLATVLRRSEPERALEYAERANKLAPQNPAVADTLGILLLDQGDNARALALLDQAYKGFPGHPTVTFHYASALAANGEEDRARLFLNEIARKRFPERAEAQALLDRLTKK